MGQLNPKSCRLNCSTLTEHREIVSSSFFYSPFQRGIPKITPIQQEGTMLRGSLWSPTLFTLPIRLSCRSPKETNGAGRPQVKTSLCLSVRLRVLSVRRDHPPRAAGRSVKRLPAAPLNRQVGRVTNHLCVMKPCAVAVPPHPPTPTQSAIVPR